MALAYDGAKRKAPLSIFYFNMESWSFPSNHDQAKDAWPNNRTNYATPNRENISHQPVPNFTQL